MEKDWGEGFEEGEREKVLCVEKKLYYYVNNL
jgi:hypothetical protein